MDAEEWNKVALEPGAGAQVYLTLYSVVLL